LPAGCGCDESVCEYSRTRDGFEIQCFVKPQTEDAPVKIVVNSAVPACPANPTETWVLLAEAQSGANALTISNNVRRVVRNTPAW